ncbi:MAG TPA: hypothetical protein VMV92_23310 [Streptosporangiaceae bacterium]|nr:hypothetical protein [Streptosporangiaceae bacterium]
MHKFRIMAAAIGALGLTADPVLASTGPAPNISFFTGGRSIRIPGRTIQ